MSRNLNLSIVYEASTTLWRGYPSAPTVRPLTHQPHLSTPDTLWLAVWPAVTMQRGEQGFVVASSLTFCRAAAA